MPPRTNDTPKARNARTARQPAKRRTPKGEAEEGAVSPDEVIEPDGTVHDTGGRERASESPPIEDLIDTDTNDDGFIDLDAVFGGTDDGDESASTDTPNADGDGAGTSNGTSTQAGVQAVKGVIADKLSKGIPLTASEKAKQAVILAMGGIPYRRIAEILDVSVSTAHGYVSRALKETTVESTDELRVRQFARYEHLLSTRWSEAQKPGNSAALHEVLAIMDRENNLMGTPLDRGNAGVVDNSRHVTIIATGQKDDYLAALRKAQEHQAALTSGSDDD